MSKDTINRAATLIGMLVIFAALVGFAVRADMKATVACQNAEQLDLKVETNERIMLGMAGDIKAIRAVLETMQKLKDKP